MGEQPNLNLRQRVKAGALSIAEAKHLLRAHAKEDTERTSTWKWLCRLESGLNLRKLGSHV